MDPPASDLELGEDGLVRLRAGAPPAVDAPVELQSGILEGSNVNVVSAMVSMIEHARAFELQVKMMSSVEDNDRSSAELLRLS